MFRRNEVKATVLRNFGTEQVTFTATVYTFSSNIEKVCKKISDQFQNVVFNAYIQTSYRTEREKEFLRAKLAEIEAQEKADRERQKQLKEQHRNK